MKLGHHDGIKVRKPDFKKFLFSRKGGQTQFRGLLPFSHEFLKTFSKFLVLEQSLVAPNTYQKLNVCKKNCQLSLLFRPPFLFDTVFGIL